MTKQEAIKILKALWVSKYPEYSDDEIREALDMAIEALRDDCQKGILTPEERSEVLNAIDDALHGYKVDGYEDTDGMFFKVLISKVESCSEEPNELDLIRRQDAIDALSIYGDKLTLDNVAERIYGLSSAQPEDWMERNKERILQAGMEGREIEFRIGGRLFAIREKAQ